ncbi:MAG: hypothetical protein JWR37_1123 [Mycobacterium sp.]|nr:hypothetical protein [Mycobacterium sp.]
MVGGHLGAATRDARLVLVSMSFVASAAFLGLRALATPRVLISHPNAGCVVAVPIGLVIAAAFALLATVAGWAAWSLDLAGPDDRRLRVDRDGVGADANDERFSDLYLDDVAGATRDVTVFFPDLEGFTKFSEEHPPDVVRTMLNTYLEAVLPDIRAAGGRVDRFIGEAVMVTFNVSVDHPDHAARAARAALNFQNAAQLVAIRHRNGRGSGRGSIPGPPSSEWSVMAGGVITR